MPTDIEHQLIDALFNIILNAQVVPDPQADGATDCFAVPLDDIEAARALLAKVFPPAAHEPFPGFSHWGG